MKRTFLIVFCLFLSLSYGFAQEKAVATFVKITHDFSEIQETGGDVSTDFVVKNTGKTPLVINRVTASCGCTTPDWTKAPIAPGKTGLIKATYSPKGRPGPFSKSITVYTNAVEPSSILVIKGDVLMAEK
ncbi:hypothetical protein AwDysgo_06180 [Bacteroidales bacterium]|nr:hypothetical protein AwDysgo_06180 [Bacteroidales bacterium]